MNKPFEFNQGRPLSIERSGVTVTKIGVHLGAEVSGVDLRRPLPDDQFKAVEDALVEHELTIFRDQDISSENLMSFGRRFNELTVHPFAPNEGKNAPELIKFRNDEKTPPYGTDVWHSDETFRAEPPMATILVAKEVPQVGGDTMYVSMSAAYDGLSDRMQ
ncbi:MAG: TauD/TfdA family dioxygenase, partial [Pseudolabrys sp.]